MTENVDKDVRKALKRIEGLKRGKRNAERLAAEYSPSMDEQVRKAILSFVLLESPFVNDGWGDENSAERTIAMMRAMIESLFSPCGNPDLEWCVSQDKRGVFTVRMADEFGRFATKNLAVATVEHMAKNARSFGVANATYCLEKANGLGLLDTDEMEHALEILLNEAGVSVFASNDLLKKISPSSGFMEKIVKRLDDAAKEKSFSAGRWLSNIEPLCVEPLRSSLRRKLAETGDAGSSNALLGMSVNAEYIEYRMSFLRRTGDVQAIVEILDGLCSNKDIQKSNGMSRREFDDSVGFVLEHGHAKQVSPLLELPQLSPEQRTNLIRKMLSFDFEKEKTEVRASLPNGVEMEGVVLETAGRKLFAAVFEPLRSTCPSVVNAKSRLDVQDVLSMISLFANHEFFSYDSRRGVSDAVAKYFSGVPNETMLSALERFLAGCGKDEPGLFPLAVLTNVFERRFHQGPQRQANAELLQKRVVEFREMVEARLLASSPSVVFAGDYSGRGWWYNADEAAVVLRVLASAANAVENGGVPNGTAFPSSSLGASFLFDGSGGGAEIPALRKRLILAMVSSLCEDELKNILPRAFAIAEQYAEFREELARALAAAKTFNAEDDRSGAFGEPDL